MCTFFFFFNLLYFGCLLIFICILHVNQFIIDFLNKQQSFIIKLTCLLNDNLFFGLFIIFSFWLYKCCNIFQRIFGICHCLFTFNHLLRLLLLKCILILCNAYYLFLFLYNIIIFNVIFSFLISSTTMINFHLHLFFCAAPLLLL